MRQCTSAICDASADAALQEGDPPMAGNRMGNHRSWGDCCEICHKIGITSVTVKDPKMCHFVISLL